MGTSDSQVPMLQLLCNTSVEANSLNANTSVSTGFLYACLKGPVMVMQQVTLYTVATIVIINGPVLRKSQKSSK